MIFNGGKFPVLLLIAVAVFACGTSERISPNASAAPSDNASAATPEASGGSRLIRAIERVFGRERPVIREEWVRDDV